MNSSRSGYTFSRVPSVARPRSTFDRSRTYKSAFDSGYLIPFYWDEVLPGDTFNLSLTSFARLSTPIVPFMDNVWMQFFYFFVPCRLVWENWQRFCGEQDNPDDSTDYLIPQVEFSEVGVGSLADYFGLPVGDVSVTPDEVLKVNALPFRAYNLVWNEFFRDENLQDSVSVPVDDGPDSQDDYLLLKRGKRKTDPFTSALPWPQKGPGVELPIMGDTTLPVHGNGNVLGISDGTINGKALAYHTTYGLVPSRMESAGSVLGADVGNGAFSASGVGVGVSVDPLKSGLVADLTGTTYTTINALREAFQVQRWFEQLARGGSRYTELVLSMFGVHTGDARLQRPEYLGGGKVPIQIHAVTQTSSTDATSPQGNLAAIGVSGQSGSIGFSKSFVEHGYVVGLVCVYSDYTYQQGLDRMWSRRNKFDFYWPAFAHLGEVPVLNKEIFYQGDSSIDDQAFGYQERWYEYRYGINKITGKLRSGVPGSLDVWHLAQYFDNLPTLSSDFIQESPPLARVLAVQDEPQIIFDSLTKCRCTRCMPVYSVPGLIDHF